LGTEDARLDDEAVFAAFDWMMEADREPIQKMYNMTDQQMDALNFHHFWKLTDEATALEFEGSEHVREEFFSDDEWELSN